MTVLAFPINQIRPQADAVPACTGYGQAARAGDNRGSQDAPRHLPALWVAPPGPSAQPTSYEAMMVYRLGLGRPWLDMLNHDDQARVMQERK